MQVGEKITTDGAARSHESRPFAPVRSPFVTRLLPDSAATAARPRVLQDDRLLSVREAAEQLGLCTATVYQLVGEGQLPHVRVLNAIRVAPRDLAAFVEGQRRAGHGGPAGA